ncbi:uncharacterized protein LAESUDRAFT_816899 [Laetiporus sulphureus 93-53]|uniref:Uncharacterized protein n=1 Tax=Laetiporus sulphureus 93-53 TaxID=1314785 RepID=A0A165AT43_9APHY|nr:uncharacterized protein LAESUDRAFT_816899 [Laetiporus sulphureus 93-53]KZS99606.1 hypothetical protein LAESUDRAFT_816899 [Laetiporus sulphureus 93-53]
MKLTYFASAVLAVLVVLPAAHAEVKAACGTDGEVVSNTTFVHNGHQISVVTQSCPGFAQRRALERREPVLQEKRQLDICGYEATIECEDLGAEPLLASCLTLTDALEDLGTETFYSGPDTLTTFTDNAAPDCVYGFANPTADYYYVCYETVGELGWVVADDCYSYGGGYGVVGTEWYLEVYN